MKLTRFRIFAKAVRAIPDLAQKNPKIFRLFEGAWYDEDSKLVVDPTTLTQLGETTRCAGKAWRERNSRKCYFPLHDLGAIIALEFPKAPNIETQKGFLRKLTACYSNSKNEFVATYDTLTELLNRPGFEDRLHSALGNLCDNTSPTTPSLSLRIKGVSFGLFFRVNQADSFVFHYIDALAA